MFHVLVPCISRLGNAIFFLPVSELGSLFIDNLLQTGALQLLEELGQIVVDVDTTISKCIQILIAKPIALLSMALSFMARTCSGKSSSVPSQK